MQNRCELYADGISDFRRIQISKDSVFNVTSGYCHQPDLTRLVDFNPPDPISTTLYGSEDKGKTFFFNSYNMVSKKLCYFMQRNFLTIFSCKDSSTSPYVFCLSVCLLSS